MDPQQNFVISNLDNFKEFPAFANMSSAFKVTPSGWSPQSPPVIKSVPLSKEAPLLVPELGDVYHPSFQYTFHVPEMVSWALGTPVLFKCSVYVTSSVQAIDTSEGYTLTVNAGQVLANTVLLNAYSGTMSQYVQRAILYFAGSLKKITPSISIQVNWQHKINNILTISKEHPILYDATLEAVPVQLGDRRDLSEDELIDLIMSHEIPILKKRIIADVCQFELL